MASPHVPLWAGAISRLARRRRSRAVERASPEQPKPLKGFVFVSAVTTCTLLDVCMGSSGDCSGGGACRLPTCMTSCPLIEAVGSAIGVGIVC